MVSQKKHAVTGAFGYSGKYITQRLLDKGETVITLTNSTNRLNPFGDRVKIFPFNFDQPEKLAGSLKGVDVLYNTYWIRFNHPLFSHADGVKNTLILFEAAKKAGVKRVVHVSITNPSLESPLEYFHGKAVLEKALIESGLSYAILRPAVLFGKEDVLINNIAWVLRRFPIVGVFGDGSYKLQPIYVDDLAKLAVENGQSENNCIINAIGPETFTYLELFKEIGKIIKKERPIISVPPIIGYIVAKMVGILVDDVMLTKQEIEGLMAGLLAVNDQPAGSTRLTNWIRKHANTLGFKYTSEMARRKDRKSGYESN